MGDVFLSVKFCGYFGLGQKWKKSKTVEFDKKQLELFGNVKIDGGCCDIYW